MRIGVDIDGTLTDSGVFIEKLNQIFNQAKTLSDWHVYELDRVYGVARKDVEDFFRNSPQVYQNINPRKEALELLQWAQKMQARIYYVSARDRDLVLITKKWLAENGFPPGEVFCLQSQDKIPVFRQLGVDVVLEDCGEIAEKVAAELNIPVILVDYPYNRLVRHSLIYRIKEFWEAKIIIKEIAMKNPSC